MALALIALPPVAFCAETQTARGDAPQIHSIDLPTALRLAQAQNIDIQIARERRNEAQANHAVAVAKFLPWISAGIAFRRHEGRTQAVDGTLVDVDKQSTTYGPAVTAQLDIGDATFSTLAAQQTAVASSAALSAQQQDSALSAAAGYFDLLKAKALVDATQEALKTSEDYEQQIHGAVGAGIAFKGDELRVQTQTERYRVALTQTRQQQRSAAARLAQILHMDPTVELVPLDSDLVPIALMDFNSSAESLLSRALRSRSEVQRSEALAAAARDEKNNAVYGPLIPSIGMQAFLGDFGGGPGNASANFGASRDYYFGVNWRIGPGGLFDFSRINATKARLHIAELNVGKVTDEIKRQVVAGQSRTQSLAEQMRANRRSLTAATETLRLTRERKQFGVGTVLEDIQAQQELARARADYVSAIAEFNKAQYELSKALGTLTTGDNEP